MTDEEIIMKKAMLKYISVLFTIIFFNSFVFSSSAITVYSPYAIGCESGGTSIHGTCKGALVEDYRELGTVIQDSRYIPEDDTNLQKIIDHISSSAPDANLTNIKIYPKYRIFSAPFIYDLLQGYRIHEILIDTSYVTYSIGWQYDILRPGDTAYETVYGGGGYYNVNAATNLIYKDVYEYYSAYDDFMEDPLYSFESTAITAEISEEIEIEYIFCFFDYDRGAKIIYLVTNKGDYIYYFSSIKDDLTFLFPLEDFKTCLKKVYKNCHSNGYNLSKDPMNTIWDSFALEIADITDFTRSFSKEELLPYIVGGEEKITKSNEMFDYYENHHSNSTSTEPIPVSSETAPQTITYEKELDVYKILFIAESAIVSCCLLGFVIFKLVKIKKKE